MSRTQDLRDLTATLRYLYTLVGPKPALATVRQALIEAERDRTLRNALAVRLIDRFGQHWQDADLTSLNDDDAALWETGWLIFGPDTPPPAAAGER